MTEPHVPWVRLDGDAELADELMDAVRRVAAAGAFTLGAEVEAFEDELAAYCGTDHAIGVSSGTEALVLALRALGIGPGDEVVVPANTFIGTAEAVTLVGATPRLADVDPDTENLTAATLEPALGPRTRCVIPVHLHGATVDLDPIVALARRAGIAVVEDACQAHGARMGDRRAGAVGDCGCFSFYPSKNLGGWGDGGAVVTSDPALAQRIRLLRSHGEDPAERHRHQVAGTTARLDSLQAALLRVKLPHLEGWNEQRRAAAARLSAALAGTGLGLPPSPPEGDHVFHHYAVRTADRGGLRAHLAEQGVGTGVHYPTPIHLTEAYAHLGLRPGSLPVAERLAEQTCSLPMYPSLGEAELERVVAAVDGWALAPSAA